MPEDAKEVAEKVESFYERFHKKYEQWSRHWREHTNRRTIIVAILAGVSLGALYLFAIRPPGDFPSGQLVTIPEGESLSQVAQTLQEAGVIRSALVFRIIVKAEREDHMLHAGDYLFKQPLDVFSIARRIALGAYGLEPFRFRIPDGATTAQMADVYGTLLQRFDKQAFLAQAQPMEGYLFPDTYFFLPNATADTVIAAMRQNFDTHIASITPEIASSTHSLADIITMASIVEREARNFTDRRMIAGVLWRRIKLGMPLQADATFRYTNGKGSFDLTMADLKSTSPYNTYTHKGLPPTPIGSPSIKSIEAAATPIDQGYLYYMADNSGVTHYCKTFTCQRANERLYLGK